MMILKEPAPWTPRGRRCSSRASRRPGIDATIQAIPSTQWFDRLYTKRNHEGIAVNAGTLPFPWALTANYMMKASLLKNPPKYPKPAIPALEAAYNIAFSSANEAQYAAALKAVQRLMLTQAAVFHTMIAANQNVAPQEPAWASSRRSSAISDSTVPTSRSARGRTAMHEPNGPAAGSRGSPPPSADALPDARSSR